MRDVDVCPACGGSKRQDRYYCTDCCENEQLVYKLIRQYLRTYPHSNAIQVANATGIPISKITKYIREGSLSILGE
ncbi:MAG: hypothetical protein H0Z34_07505 [Brevibacillus sp.]|nr:hypothetical protein [Brevibacillus sp.]